MRPVQRLAKECLEQKSGVIFEKKKNTQNLGFCCAINLLLTSDAVKQQQKIKFKFKKAKKTINT